MEKNTVLRTGLASIAMLCAAAMADYASAKEAGDLLVRARAIMVVPDEGGTTSINGSPSIDNAVTPELDFTYFITDNIGVELILATAKHHPSVTGSALGDVDLGSIWLLPPTLTVQYHFNPQGQISPYVGAGLNYTFFYNDSVPGGAIGTIDYDNSFGYVAQAGVDYQIDDKWSVNLDVKKLWLDTDVSINGNLGAVTADVDIDPWIFGIGFGYIF